MERVCKNCTHFNPDTSICDFKDLIKLENDWCWGFLEEEKENKMKVLDINKDQLRLLTDLEEDGATIFFKESYMLEKVDLNDLEIE